jgi:hypothetical protein
VASSKSMSSGPAWAAAAAAALVGLGGGSDGGWVVMSGLWAWWDGVGRAGLYAYEGKQGVILYVVCGRRSSARRSSVGPESAGCGAGCVSAHGQGAAGMYKTTACSDERERLRCRSYRPVGDGIVWSNGTVQITPSCRVLAPVSYRRVRASHEGESTPTSRRPKHFRSLRLV